MIGHTGFITVAKKIPLALASLDVTEEPEGLGE
jgi:hypothetical protein